MSRGPGKQWTRRYPPLIAVAVALVLVVFALPSALNLPQANPSQTLEYAPVPGDANSAPAGGNFAGLDLGSGGEGTGPVGVPPQASQPPPPPPLNGTPGHPDNKQCVGNPPRQTEDPLSPPCVAYYKGDNGGATYTGVTAGEVRVLYYLTGGGTDYTTGSGPQPVPKSKLVDLGKPLDKNDGEWAAVLRTAQTDFNARYQTYMRTVHLWIYFDAGLVSGSPGVPEARRQDAADNYAAVHPFAVISYPQYDSQDYLAAMAQRGVLSLVGSKMENTGAIGAPASYFRSYRGLLWSFDPSIDYRASEFASLVCSQVANRAVKFSGNITDAQKPRKLGLLISKDPTYPEQSELGNAVRADLSACGANVAMYGSKYDNSGSGYIANATTQMAAFKNAGITTVIDPGQGVYESRAANGLSYYPEWIIGGDGLADATLNGSLNDQTVFKNAWLMTTWVHRGPQPQQDPCVQSAVAGDPTINVQVDALQFYCPIYDSTRQLFTAIQVAGPKLTPSQVDAGFHAIPHVANSSNRVPSCFYDSGDYTCVKDAMLEWWDPAGQDPEYGGTNGSSPSGCWRLVENGARQLGNWPSRELYSGHDGAAQCNGQF